MTVHGVGNIVRIDGGFDTELYHKILEEYLAPIVHIWRKSG